MRSRRSLKSAVDAGLWISILITYLLNCSFPTESTYKQKDIPAQIEKICQEEYNLKVITKSSYNTLWIYVPLPNLLHKEFGINKEKFLDEEIINKLRNILITVGRVFLSADNPPEFYCLLASDINIGIDYILIGNTLDIKKSYVGFIPWPEANRRYIIKIELNPEAISDETGTHLKPYPIKLEDFLAQQIAQRISMHFQHEELKKYFQVEKVTGTFSDDTFIFEYAIKKVKDSKFKIDDEIISIVSYVLNSYEFDKFLMVEIKDLLSDNKTILSKARIKEIK
ncbi:MAG: hypothetical protein NC909_00940 [Candidatus Omnitrophica bacterium]|nr:hypothetical protein [Candidatus Omnitrophota bacterium]